MPTQRDQRLSPRVRISLLTAAMGLATWTGLAQVGPADARFDLGMPWWLVACLFLIAELHSVHIEIRQEQHRVSLSEAATVVGLVFLPPFHLVAARVLGGLVSIVVRKTTLSKRAFNLVLFAFEATAAIVVIRVLPETATLGATGAAAVATAICASMLGGLVVSAAIAAVGNGSLGDALRNSLVPLAASATGAASLGALIALILWVNVSFGIYLAVIVFAVESATRSHTATVQKMTDLEAAHRYSVALSSGVALDDVIITALHEARDLLRVEHTALVIVASSSLAVGRYEVVDGGLVHVACPEAPTIGHLAGPRASSVGVEAMASVVPTHTVEAAAVSVVLTDDTQAVLLATDTRAGRVNHPDRLRLFTGLAAQAGIALSRAALLERLSHEAHHDALTGLPNRVWFGEQLAARMPTTGSVLLIDLDRFKDVNDTLGHPTGDRVLTIIARRLEGLVGPRDLLARLGGDEFALFTPGAPDEHGHPAIIKSVVAAIETPVSIDEFSVHVGASIGVARAPDHGDDETTLLSRADIAMYCAKQSGSTQHVYHPDDDTHSPARLKLQVDLRHAVEHRGLEPWYQPKVDTATGAIVGLEALCRWRHADGSFVSPGEFVPIAEASGLMRKLTTSVLERVVADLRSWATLGLHVPVAVNLSARDLLDESLPDQIATMLELNGVAPELLGFEVTETAFMVDRDRVVETLRRLRDAGATLAIDDYGTGYSSMSYLKDLPVDVLKIDRAFVDGVDRDPLNHALVKSTIELGHNLGLTVVAEGVERAEEHEQLIALGCDQCQGYYFDRPMPNEQLIERLLVPRETSTLLG